MRRRFVIRDRATGQFLGEGGKYGSRYPTIDRAKIYQQASEWAPEGDRYEYLPVKVVLI